MAVRLGKDLMPALLQHLTQFFPQSLPIHGVLHTIFRLGADQPEVWADSWPDFGAILVRLSSQHQQIPTLTDTIRTFATDPVSAGNLTSEVDLFGDRERVDFGATQRLLWPIIEQRAYAAGYNMQVSPIMLIDFRGFLHSAPDTSQLVPPSGFRAAPLEPHHAPFIASVWEHNVDRAAAELYMRKVIKTFPNVVVYDTYDDVAAFVMRYEDRALGHLYVSPFHRRHGLARLAMLHIITRVVRERPLVAFGYVESTNFKAMNLYCSLGNSFVYRDNVAWLYCTKNGV